MYDNLITHLQIFGIGFSFAIAGPCLLVCTPILITYIAGRQDRLSASLVDVSIFLSGRLIAYVLLGAAAGLSGSYLRRMVQADLGRYFNLAGGLISVILGALILFRKDVHVTCNEERYKDGIYGRGSILALGFIIGISPCGPLTGLLFEVALMSKSATDGALYALSFALGTFIAGFVIIGALSGILKGFALKVVKSDKATRVFRVLCASLLLLLGVGLIWRSITAS